MAPSPFRLIIITGAAGIDKTTVGRLLFERCPPWSAWVDVDDLIQIRPWQIDQDFFALAGANIRACIANYRAWGARYLIVSGTIAGGLCDQVALALSKIGLESAVYALWADPETIRHRVLSDATHADLARRPQEPPFLNGAVLGIPGSTLIDVTALSPGQVVQHICSLEGLGDGRRKDEAAAAAGPGFHADRRFLQWQMPLGDQNAFSPPVRLILITGVPGVGKTTVGRMVFERCPLRVAWVDIDFLVRVRPWRIDKDFLALVGANLRACLANYKAWGAQWLVVSGLITVNGIYDELAHYLSNTGVEIATYALWADLDAVRQRILRDATSYFVQRFGELGLELGLDDAVRKLPGCVAIDTTDLSPSEVAERLFELEGLFNDAN